MLIVTKWIKCLAYNPLGCKNSKTTTTLQKEQRDLSLHRASLKDGKECTLVLPELQFKMLLYHFGHSFLLCLYLHL